MPILLDGPGPRVLLLHGFTGSPFAMHTLAQGLAARGCRVSVPLLPGHGTTPAELSRMRWTDFLHASRAALDALSLPGEVSTVIVGGLSMGGLLALHLAGAPETRVRVRAVMTYGVALRFPATVTGLLRVLRAAGDHLPDWYAPKRSQDLRDEAMASASPAYATRPLRSSRELLVGQAEVRRLLSSVTVPLLAMHGLLDRTCPMEASTEVIASVATRDAALVVLPNSGHQVCIDRDRDAALRMTADFVTRVG